MSDNNFITMDMTEDEYIKLLEGVVQLMVNRYGNTAFGEDELIALTEDATVVFTRYNDSSTGEAVFKVERKDTNVDS